MDKSVKLSAAYRPSEDVVVRDIEGELIIVPLVAGLADLEDALFTVNESGRAIWDRLDGQQTVEQIIGELAVEYDAPTEELRADVIGFLEEVLQRGLVIEVAQRQA